MPRKHREKNRQKQLFAYAHPTRQGQHIHRYGNRRLQQKNGHGRNALQPKGPVYKIGGQEQRKPLCKGDAQYIEHHKLMGFKICRRLPVFFHAGLQLFMAALLTAQQMQPLQQRQAPTHYGPGQGVMKNQHHQYRHTDHVQPNAQIKHRQDLLQIYQKQTDLRDELRQESRERIVQIINEINHGEYESPKMQMIFIQLADRLAKAKGKKQYGYLNAGTKKLVDAIVTELAGDSRIQELYSLWYEQKEDVLRTYTNKMPERIPLEQQKEFKAIRNAVVQTAMRLHIPQEELPLSGPVLPRVDFVDDGSDMYPKVVSSLREPEVEPSPEVKQYLHEAAIRGSVDAVYGIGKQYLKTDIRKAISMFELAAEQGNSYAEYQLGKLYCFGQGVPQNLEVGMEWLTASARHGNEYASALLEKVQNHIHQQTTSAVFSLFRGLAGLIQTSANRHIHRRDSIDRKQRQKIEEKKQAHGQRSDGQDYSNDMELTM